MNDKQEFSIARIVRRYAKDWVRAYDTNPCDLDAATAAVLMRALELATPDLSAEARARLFKGELE